MASHPPTTISSGYNTPDSELESIVPVHPTAVRRPTYITVQSENTVYTDSHITAKYLDRGADVLVSDGQFTITPTVKPYEFQTTRKVGKTGYVMRFRSVFTI
jgi:myo-inositol-1-phosphate synthase